MSVLHKPDSVQNTTIPGQGLLPRQVGGIVDGQLAKGRHPWEPPPVGRPLP